MKCLSDISLFNLLFLLGDTPVDGLKRPKLVGLHSRSPWNTLSLFLMTLNYLVILFYFVLGRLWLFNNSIGVSYPYLTSAKAPTI